MNNPEYSGPKEIGMNLEAIVEGLPAGALGNVKALFKKIEAFASGL